MVFQSLQAMTVVGFLWLNNLLMFDVVVHCQWGPAISKATLWLCQNSKLENGPVEIVRFLIQRGDFPQLCQSFPKKTTVLYFKKDIWLTEHGLRAPIVLCLPYQVPRVLLNTFCAWKIK